MSILDRLIDKALADAGMSLDDPKRPMARATFKLGAGMLSAAATGPVTAAHHLLAAEIALDVLESAAIPEEDLREAGEEVLGRVLKLWDDYAEAKNDKH